VELLAPPTTLRSFRDYAKDHRPIIRDASSAAVGIVCKMALEHSELGKDSSSAKEFVIVS
jgi:hypothetical protein